MIAGVEMVIIAACMVAEAFFSGMETGVISIQRLRLRHLVVEENSRSGKILEGFLDHSDHLLGTTLVGTNICVVVASVLAASLAGRISPAWGKAISSVVMTMLLLVFSEYLPKAWFRSKPLERCIVFAETLRAASVVLRPVAIAITWLTGWLVPRSDNNEQPFVTRDDLKVLTGELGRKGVISQRERAMIHRVFELSSRNVGEIMIPRDEMVCVQNTMPIPDVIQTARGSGFTRLPVRGEKDQIVGIVNISDVLAAGSSADDAVAADYMRAPHFITEDMPVDDVLPRMRSLRQPMCLVANRESVVIGLVTTEDVLEEIVGKL
jgi:putative hemolysin